MQSQVTTLTATSSEDLYEKLKELGESKRSIDNDILKAKRKEIEIKECLENKTPYHWYEPSWMMSYSPRRDLFYPEISEAELLKFLEVVLKKKDELAKKRIPLTEEIKQKEEELKRENEELKMNVSSHFDKWIEHAHDKGNESTLFVVHIVSGWTYLTMEVPNCILMIEECLKQKLSLISHTKLVINEGYSPMLKDEKIPPETLHVFLPRRIGFGRMLELLNKRYRSLDLIAVMRELKRTYFVSDDDDYPYNLDELAFGEIEILENLSFLPRLQTKGLM